MKTKTTTHTPGPWTIREISSGPQIVDSENRTVVDRLYSAMRRNDTDANARLIAAAPDLLAALGEVSAYLNLLRHRYCDEGRMEGLYKEVVRESEKVRAAIAKAEGR